MAKERIIEVEAAWNTPVARETLPFANPYARTNRIYTGTGRQAIARKLNGIVLERYEVPGDLELSEVVKDLHRIARDRDVDKAGINFIVSSFLDKPGPAPAAAGLGFPGAVDPLTGAANSDRPRPTLPFVSKIIKSRSIRRFQTLG